MIRISATFLTLALAATGFSAPVVINRAFHRDGQTFITWLEQDGVDAYHLYRSDQPISKNNIDDLEPLALNGKTFEIRQGTSQLNRCQQFFNTKIYPDNLLPEEIHSFHELNAFVIDGIDPESDTNTFAPQIPVGTGHVVWTPAAGSGWDGAKTYYYAVTAANSRELGVNSVVGVAETADRPKPILVWQSESRKTRMYTQYMALQREGGIDWNPYFMMYGNFYTIEVPEDYDYENPEKLPVYFSLHGGGASSQPSDLEADTRLIRIMPNDRFQTWWFGWSSAHDFTDFRINGDWDQGHCFNSPTFSPPTEGPIVNYKEMEMMRALFDMADDPLYHLDEERIFAEGPSTGAMGTLFLGLRFPEIFSSVFAEKPQLVPRIAEQVGTVCNQDVDPDVNSLCNEPIKLVSATMVPLWGAIDAELPVVIQAPWMPGSDRVRVFDKLEKFNGMPVFDYMDFIAMLTGNRIDKDGNAIARITPNFQYEETAFFMASVAMRDCAASWDVQGRHLFPWMNTALVGFSGLVEDVGHNVERFEFGYEEWPENIPVVPRFTALSFDFGDKPNRRFSGAEYPVTRSFPALALRGASFPELPIGQPYPSPLTNCPDYTGEVDPPPGDPIPFNLNVRWHGEDLPEIIDTPEQWTVTIVMEDRILRVGDMDGDRIFEPDWATEAEPTTVSIVPRRLQQFKPDLVNDRIVYQAKRDGYIVDEGIVNVVGSLMRTNDIVLTKEPTTITFRVSNDIPESFFIY